MSPKCDFPLLQSLSSTISVDSVIQIALIYCLFQIQVASASIWKFSTPCSKLAYKARSKPFVRVQKMGGAELRHKYRICSKRKGLRSTKTTPLTRQVLPAQLLESIVAKNGDRSSVDLSVMNERPPTFIVKASVIVVAVLRQMRIVDELQRRLCRCITAIASTRPGWLREACVTF
jgi:hypothetical protein